MNAKGLLIDLDGTLYVEDAPIPGAREALSRVEAAGIPYRYVLKAFIPAGFALLLLQFIAETLRALARLR